MNDHVSLGYHRRCGPLSISEARREAMRTTLWLVPSVMVLMAILAFAFTYAVDRAIGEGSFQLPAFVTSGSPDAARQVLIAISAAVITVAGVLFSITIIVLQLASQQFGPRMLRNFIRDLGTQFSLGAFVGTFVYSVLALASVQSAPAQEFVPHLSVTVALVFTLADLGVVIYFIHHVATSIQLTFVVSGIARDFRSTLADLHAGMSGSGSADRADDDTGEISQRVLNQGTAVYAHASGFIQAVGYRHLMAIAETLDTVIRLMRRPGHFVIEGQLVAFVLPGPAAPHVSEALRRAHIVGPNRTLAQDPALTPPPDLLRDPATMRQTGADVQALRPLRDRADARAWTPTPLRRAQRPPETTRTSYGTWYHALDDTDATDKLGKEVVCQRGDLSEAATWYRRAAAAGHSGAKLSLWWLLHRRGESAQAETFAVTATASSSADTQVRRCIRTGRAGPGWSGRGPGRARSASGSGHRRWSKTSTRGSPLAARRRGRGSRIGSADQRP